MAIKIQYWNFIKLVWDHDDVSNENTQFIYLMLGLSTNFIKLHKYSKYAALPDI